MKTKAKFWLTAMVFLLASAQAVYAGGEHKHGHGDASAGKPGKAEHAVRTIEVVMRDNYYEPESVAIKEGETVRFVVKNEGVLVHEFNIGTAAMHAAHKDEMLEMMKHGILTPTTIDREKMESSHGEHAMKHDDPNSVLLAPGESGEVIWQFPSAASLEFACNIPGHYDAGMVGAFELQ